MESLELRIFKEVAYMKSITKAANKMGYVQSNITAHIKKLEIELNVTLFIRHNKGITLTNEGEKLLVYADKIVELIDKIPFEFNKKQSHLNIGATQTISGFYLPKFLSIYKSKHKDTCISISTLNQIDLYDKLLDDSLDCMFTNSNNTYANLKEILIINENLVLIAPKSCKKIEDIFDYPLIVNNIETCPYRKFLSEWIFTIKQAFPEFIEMDTIESICNSVSSGLGISLVPDYVLTSNKNISKFVINEIKSNKIRMLIKDTCSNSISSELKSIIEANI